MTMPPESEEESTSNAKKHFDIYCKGHLTRKPTS